MDFLCCCSPGWYIYRRVWLECMCVEYDGAHNIAVLSAFYLDVLEPVVLLTERERECVCEWLSCLFAESPKKRKSSKSKRRSKESREGSVPPAVDPPSEGTGGGVNGIVASPEREGAPPTEGEWGGGGGGDSECHIQQQ